ncbi:MAG: calcium-binding protein [Alphaproteobacteria bacterium]|nr:calcium-binding protein [Alphaproteobacteria bacterium]
MPLVTVPGAKGTTIQLQFQTAIDTFRAQGLLANVYAAAAGNDLVVKNLPKAAAGGNKLHEFTLGDQGGHQGSGPTVGVVPLGYLAIVDAKQSGEPSEIVGADQANETVVATGSLQFFPGAGSGTLISAQGDNVVVAPNTGGGDWSLYFDNGSNTVLASSGNYFIETDTPVTFGTNDITLGSGADTVLSYGADSITGGSGPAVIELMEANASVASGGGASTIIANAADVSLTQGTGPDTVFAVGNGGVFQGGDGALTFVMGFGASETVMAGSGNTYAYGAPASNSTFVVGTGGFVLDGGSGNQTVIGNPGASNALLFAENGGAMNVFGATDNVLIAGDGAVTLNAGGAGGANLLYAGSGRDCLVGGAGADTLVAGPAVDTLVAGTGATVVDLVQSFAGLGTELVLGWTPRDQLDLSGWGAPTAPGGLPAGASLQVSHGSTVLALADGTRVVFAGVTNVSPSQIHST